jgi:hypothetical protein
MKPISKYIDLDSYPIVVIRYEKFIPNAMQVILDINNSIDILP